MAFKQIDGSAVSNTSTNNNGGTLRHAGTIGSTLFTNQTHSVVPVDSNYRVKESQYLGAGKILSGGTFGVLTPNAYVVRRLTTTLAGVANTNLLSGASDFGHRHAIHKIETVRGTFLQGLSWDATSSEAPVYTATLSQTETAFDDDHAARPSLATPGELVYRTGGPLPVQDDYEAKTTG
jgi:hypothetical protein